MINLSKYALIAACIALLISIGSFAYNRSLNGSNFAVAPEGATCSNVYSIYGVYALGCTGFPGVVRTDVIAAGATAPLGTSALAYTTTASTSLASNFDCTYDAINVNGGATTTAVSMVLPAATTTNLGVPGTTSACLSVDGASDNTMLIVADSSNTVTIATSTGDILVWNASTSVSGITSAMTNVLPSSSVTYYIMLSSYRTNSSTVVYSLTPTGVGH